MTRRAPTASLPRALVTAAALAAAACGRGSDERPDGAGTLPASSPAAEADTLGRELFELADVVASYEASHRGRRPASLRQLGLDSLAPQLVRRLHRRGDTLLLEVAYRRPGARAVHACTGTTDLLEDASLHGGAFPALCRDASGAADTFTISPAAPPSTARND